MKSEGRLWEVAELSCWAAAAGLIMVDGAGLGDTGGRGREGQGWHLRQQGENAIARNKANTGQAEFSLDSMGAFRRCGF